MPKDYRKRTKSRAAKSNTNNFTWVVFGILIGLFLAILFYWHQKTPNGSELHVVSAHKTATVSHAEQLPAAKKSQVPTTPEFDFYTVLPQMQVTPTNHPAQTTSPPVRPPVVPISVRTTTPTTSAAPPTTTPAAEPDLATIPETASPPSPTTQLNKETSPPTSPVNAEPTSLPSPLAEKKPTETKDTEPSNYLLQMASLKNYADADRFKAQLTILGFDVYIQSYTVNEQIYNRVVMGPYSSKTAATQQQARLQKNHVPSILIKAP